MKGGDNKARGRLLFPSRSDYWVIMGRAYTTHTYKQLFSFIICVGFNLGGFRVGINGEEIAGCIGGYDVLGFP